MQAGQGQRERGTEVPKQTPCRAQTHEPQDHDLSQSHLINGATQVPLLFLCLFMREGGSGQRERETEDLKQALH